MTEQDAGAGEDATATDNDRACYVDWLILTSFDRPRLLEDEQAAMARVEQLASSQNKKIEPEDLKDIFFRARREAGRRSARLKMTFYILLVFVPILLFSVLNDHYLPHSPISNDLYVPAILIGLFYLGLMPFIRWRRCLQHYQNSCERAGHISDNEQKNKKNYVREFWNNRRKLYIQDGPLAVTTPALLVGALGFLLAFLNILELHQPPTSLTSQRKFMWLLENGKGDLAMAALWSLTVFLIESVIGNLSLTRDGLQEATINARETVVTIKDASKRVEDVRGDLRNAETAMRKATETLSEGQKISAFFSVLQRVSELRVLKDLVSSASEPEDTRRDVATLSVSITRLDGLNTQFSKFFGTIAKHIKGKLPSDGPLKLDDNLRKSLRELTILATVLESVFQADAGDLIKHQEDLDVFEIVAPYQSLAGIVAKILDALLSLATDLRRFVKEDTEFFTIAPILPQKFLNFARLDAKNEPIDEESREWLSFLTKSKEAVLDDFKIHRHFLAVSDELIRKLRRTYGLHLTDDSINLNGGDEESIEWRHRWNPLAHDTGLLSEEEIKRQLALQVVEQPRGHWKEIEGSSDPQAESLLSALEKHHRPGDLRVICVDSSELKSDGNPVEDSMLRVLLETEGNDLFLVDYFAARIRNGAGSEWAFCIRSTYDSALQAVRIRLFFPGNAASARYWEAEVAKLDKIFGRDGATPSHTKGIREFVSGSTM